MDYKDLEARHKDVLAAARTKRQQKKEAERSRAENGFFN